MPNIKIEYSTEAFDYPYVGLPEVWTVRHKVSNQVINDLEGSVKLAVDQLLVRTPLAEGASIAVGVGSRGIDNLVEIVRVVIWQLKSKGLNPFIVPAMGSHGGATAEGQISVLHDYGITTKAVGAEIRATMDVVEIGALEDGYPVYLDKNAAGADGVIVINRIKHHTDFVGPIQSGICKMLAIGLGKHFGASTIHRFGAQGLVNIMPKVGREIVNSANVVGGIAIIENPSGKTAEIHSVLPEDIGREREENLLKHAINLSPVLPFDNVDVLVLDEMGKNISGSGMDTHVIGRLEMPSVSEASWEGPSVRVVCVLDLTDESHGNAAGYGLADIVSRKLIEKIDFVATHTNHRTSGEGGVRRGKIPIVLEDAKSCVRTAIGACGKGHPEEVRLLRLRNTEQVTVAEISTALLDEAKNRHDIEILRGPHPIDFKHSPGHQVK